MVAVVAVCLFLSRASAQPFLATEPYVDSMRVLIVFVKFADDDFAGDPNVDFRGWPLYDDPTELPAYARGLVDDGTAPLRDSTLSSYFHVQSNGNFKLVGDIHPRVIVTLNPESSYHRPTGGYGTLTKEVLERLDAYGTDFSRYDLNEDGVLDQLFLIIRRDSERDNRTETYTGISCLDARCGGSITANAQRLAPFVADGVAVDWNRSGSILFNRVAGNIVPQLWLVRLMAHELGHDLWARHYNHIPPLSDNDLPRHIGREKHGVGYVLMAGAGGARDTGGNMTISAFERLLLGWIDCPTVVGASTFVLRDLYSSGDCRSIEFKYKDKRRALILSNLQRQSFFDKLRNGGRDNRIELGSLRTTGLLIHLTDGRRLDVVASDGDIQLSNYNDDYRGDLFSPFDVTQVTPWTDPPLTGYRDGVDSVGRWNAIESVRHRSDSGDAIQIEFRDDFRIAPRIRRDSRIGREYGTVEIQEHLEILQARTLTIAADVVVNGPITVGAGSTLVVEDGATLTVGRQAPVNVQTNGKLIVNGTLRVAGPVIVMPGAAIRPESGTLLWFDTTKDR